MTTEKRGMQIEDLYKLTFAHRVAIAPDGTQVVFSAMQPNEARDRNLYALHLVRLGDGQHRVLADELLVEPAPCWSPDGARIAYVAAVNGRPQLFTVELSSGTTRQLTAGDFPVSRPLWSPDGGHIAFIGKVPSVPAPWMPVVFDDPADTPKVITRDRYKFDGANWFDDTRYQLFVVPEAGGKPRQLTSGTTGIFNPIWTSERTVPLGGPAWSHDSSRIAVVISTEEDEARDARCDVWTVAVNSGAMMRITPNDGLYGCPAWSPDDRTLAVSGATLPRKGGASTRLWTVSADGGSMTPVDVGDLCVGSGMLGDSGAPGGAQLVWHERGIFFSAGINGTIQILQVDPEGGNVRTVTQGNHALGTWSLDSAAQTIAYCATTPTSPGEVYVQRLNDAGEPAERISRLNDALLSEVWLSEPEAFRVQASDGSGTEIEGWLMKPPGFSADKRYPLILEIHGGPHTAYGYSWYHEFQCYVAQGYLLVYCNPRGSSGYGEEFATSIYLDWGTKPMIDVMSALDHVIAQGFVDEDRLYVAGGSYGGYMVDWIVTHTDRFRAGAAGRCVSDLQTLALASDNGTIWMAEYFGGMPWEEPEVYRFGSPITYVDRCTTPLFIEHQEEDRRCTADQAEQMYNALRALGVETEMVLYPKEPHGMSRDGQPRHRVDRLIRTLDWFQRHGA